MLQRVSNGEFASVMSSKKLSLLFAADDTETRKNLLRHYYVDLSPG